MEFNRSKWLSVSFTTNRNFMSYYDPRNTCQTKPSVNAETTSNPLGRQVHSPDSPLNIVTAQCPPEKIIVVGSTKHSTHKTTTSHAWHQVYLEKWLSNLSIRRTWWDCQDTDSCSLSSPSTGVSNSIALRWPPRIWILTSFLGIMMLLAWGTTLWEPQSKKL